MGYIKIITAILIWSSLGIFIRRIDLPNQCIIFYTATVAGVLQFMILASTGLIKRIRPADRNAVFLVLAPFCFIANTMLFYYAFRNTTIANAVLTHYTAPVFVALLAPLLLKEKIYRAAWVAIVLSSIGLWFILGGTSGPAGALNESREHLGIIAGALSGLAYALLILTIRKIAPLYSSLLITFIQNVIVAVVLFPFIYSIPVSGQDVPYLITMGIFHSTIAPLLYVNGLKSVKASETAILGYFEPVGAIILAFLVLHEVPGETALLGGTLILFSGYLILRGKAG